MLFEQMLSNKKIYENRIREREMNISILKEESLKNYVRIEIIEGEITEAKDKLSEENKKIIASQNKHRVLINDLYLKTAIILVKYRIDYQEYCDFFTKEES